MIRMMDVPPGSLSNEENLADLPEWNSMAMIDFIAFADEHFGKSLSPRNFAACETVGDLGKLLDLK